MIKTIYLASYILSYLVPGGTDLERGDGECAALKTSFSHLSFSSQRPHFKQKCTFTRPLLKQFGNFSLYNLTFYPNFKLTSPRNLKKKNQLTGPQIWAFSVHKTLNLEIFPSQAPSFRGKYQFASPTLRKSGLHFPT